MDRPLPDPEADARRALRRMTRRGFGGAAAAVAAIVGGRAWLASRSAIDGLPWPFRRALEFNERAFGAAFAPDRLAREFPASAATEPRVNGPVGLDGEVDVDAWRLRVVGRGGSRELSMADLRAIPAVSSTTELKCVEGWSTVVTWTGVRLADVARATGLAGPPGDPAPYVAIETPDAAYYVGLDIAAALHPQTILAFAMNGAPLTAPHGAPVRLAIPIKYGIKNIKRVGAIRFVDDRPRDFWADRGYDWYAGL